MEKGATAILIAGPTCSGKSALALALAERTGATIVNADSMQVYSDLRILTARPSEAEELRASHRLFGHVDGAVNYSVGRWLAEAAVILRELDQAGRTAIFVGGTGLYFRALIEGLSELAPVPEPVREAVRAEAAAVSAQALHARLATVDPATAARTRPSDRLRVLRALEYHAATGGSLALARGRRRPGPLSGRSRAAVFLAADRAQLRAAIDARFHAMMANGALAEVERLARRGLDPALPVMRAHGVPPLLAHLRGELALPAAVSRGQADTRAYAKRQFTWFRHQMPGFEAVAPEAALDAVLERLANPVVV